MTSALLGTHVRRVHLAGPLARGTAEQLDPWNIGIVIYANSQLPYPTQFPREMCKLGC